MRPEVVMIQCLSSGDSFSRIAGQQLIQEIAGLDANSGRIVSITTAIANLDNVLVEDTDVS